MLNCAFLRVPRPLRGWLCRCLARVRPAPQTAKNLVLAGVGSMTLVDDTPVAEAAPGNFLVDHDADRSMRQAEALPFFRTPVLILLRGKRRCLYIAPQRSTRLSLSLSVAEASVATLAEMNPLVRTASPVPPHTAPVPAARNGVASQGKGSGCLWMRPFLLRSLLTVVVVFFLARSVQVQVKVARGDPAKQSADFFRDFDVCVLFGRAYNEQVRTALVVVLACARLLSCVNVFVASPELATYPQQLGCGCGSTRIR